MKKVIFTSAILVAVLITGCSKNEAERPNAEGNATEESTLRFTECEPEDEEDPLPMLQGTVTDTLSTDSLEGVCVKLMSPPNTLVAETGTDDNGHYFFNSVLTGSYKLVFSHAGYVTKTINVTVSGTPQNVHAQLQPLLP